MLCSHLSFPALLLRCAATPLFHGTCSTLFSRGLYFSCLYWARTERSLPNLPLRQENPAQGPTNPHPCPFKVDASLLQRRAAVRRARIAVKRTVAPQIPVFSQPEANDIIELMEPFWTMSVFLVVARRVGLRIAAGFSSTEHWRHLCVWRLTHSQRPHPWLSGVIYVFPVSKYCTGI